jgi:hypothetical protein
MLKRDHPDCPDAFHDTQFIFDGDQTPDAANEVRAYMEAYLELVDPESEYWCPVETQRRAWGERN